MDTKQSLNLSIVHESDVHSVEIKLKRHRSIEKQGAHDTSSIDAVFHYNERLICIGP
jgi:hypothetical protein